MKVKTNLKAGGVIGDASMRTADLIAEAEQQADTLVDSVVSTTTSIWNCLSSSLKRS